MKVGDLVKILPLGEQPVGVIVKITRGDRENVFYYVFSPGKEWGQHGIGRGPMSFIVPFCDHHLEQIG